MSKLERDLLEGMQDFAKVLRRGEEPGAHFKITRRHKMTDRTQPPSDELMCKVVTKWKGWDGTYFASSPQQFVADPMPAFHPILVNDPRTNTDAANDLLGWLYDEHGTLTRSEGRQWHWYAWGSDVKATFPNSGQPFRTAVCWIAVDALGVE